MVLLSLDCLRAYLMLAQITLDLLDISSTNSTNINAAYHLINIDYMPKKARVGSRAIKLWTYIYIYVHL